MTVKPKVQKESEKQIEPPSVNVAEHPQELLPCALNFDNNSRNAEDYIDAIFKFAPLMIQLQIILEQLPEHIRNADQRQEARAAILSIMEPLDLCQQAAFAFMKKKQKTPDSPSKKPSPITGVPPLVTMPESATVSPVPWEIPSGAMSK